MTRHLSSDPDVQMESYVVSYPQDQPVRFHFRQNLQQQNQHDTVKGEQNEISHTTDPPDKEYNRQSYNFPTWNESRTDETVSWGVLDQNIKQTVEGDLQRFNLNTEMPVFGYDDNRKKAESFSLLVPPEKNNSFVRDPSPVEKSFVTREYPKNNSIIKQTKDAHTPVKSKMPTISVSEEDLPLPRPPYVSDTNSKKLDENQNADDTKKSSTTLPSAPCESPKKTKKTRLSLKPPAKLTPRTSTGLIPTSFKSSLDKMSSSWTPLPPRPPPEMFPYKGDYILKQRQKNQQQQHKRCKSLPTFSICSTNKRNTKSAARRAKNDALRKYNLCSPQATKRISRRESPPLPANKRTNDANRIRHRNSPKFENKMNLTMKKESILKQKEDRWISSLGDGSSYRLSPREQKIKDDLRGESISYIRSLALEREERNKKREMARTKKQEEQSDALQENSGLKNKLEHKEDNRDTGNTEESGKENVNSHKNLTNRSVYAKSKSGAKNKMSGLETRKKKGQNQSLKINVTEKNNNCNRNIKSNVNMDTSNQSTQLQLMKQRVAALEHKLAILGFDDLDTDFDIRENTNKNTNDSSSQMIFSPKATNKSENHQESNLPKEDSKESICPSSPLNNDRKPYSALSPDSPNSTNKKEYADVDTDSFWSQFYPQSDNCNGTGHEIEDLSTVCSNLFPEDYDSFVKLKTSDRNENDTSLHSSSIHYPNAKHGLLPLAENIMICEGSLDDWKLPS